MKLTKAQRMVVFFTLIAAQELLLFKVNSLIILFKFKVVAHHLPTQL